MKKEKTVKAWLYEWQDGSLQVLWKRLERTTTADLRLIEHPCTITYEI